MVQLSACAALPLVALVTGCNRDSAASRAQSASRDVWGSPAPVITPASTVANSAEFLSKAPALVLVEELTVGAGDSPTAVQFGGIVDIDVDPEGFIYVLDRDVVQVLDSAGRATRRFGRRGQGPGEFSSPSQLAVHGDTVVVADRRVNKFNRAGDALATHSLSTTNRPVRLNALLWTERGWLLGNTVNGVPPGQPPSRPGTRLGPYSDTILLRRLDPGTGLLGEPLMRIVKEPVYLLGEAGFLLTPFMAPTPRFALGDDGKTYVTAGDDYVVDIFSPEGALTRRITGDVERIAVTESDFVRSLELELAAYAERRLEGEGKMAYDMLRNDYPTLPRAKLRPVVGRLLVNDNKSFLLERLDLDPDPLASGDASVWDLIDPGGKIAGRVTMAANVTPHRFIGDRLYARVRGELDVAGLARFRIVPASVR